MFFNIIEHKALYLLGFLIIELQICIKSAPHFTQTCIIKSDTRAPLWIKLSFSWWKATARLRSARAPRFPQKEIHRIPKVVGSNPYKRSSKSVFLNMVQCHWIRYARKNEKNIRYQSNKPMLSSRAWRKVSTSCQKATSANKQNNM